MSVKVRLNVSISYSKGPAYAPGDEAFLDDAEAERLIAAGIAEPVAEERETATRGNGRRKAVKKK